MIGVFDHLDNFGNHVAAALDLDPVPIFSPRRTMKSALCSVARLTVVPPINTGASRPPASACRCGPPARNVLHLRHARLGGELVGNRPARRAAGVAQALLRSVRIHLQNHAVNLVAKRGAAASASSMNCIISSTELHALAVRIDAEAKGGERVERSRWPGGQYSPSTSRK